MGSCDICEDAVCRYEFTIRRRQSMTYTAGNRKTYNVILNDTLSQLQIVGNSFHVNDDLIGSFVSVDDVITTDGVHRNVIVINDQFPGPAIEVMEGAQVEVTVHNKLFTDGLSIHWHGMHQMNNAWMDGVAFITQCPIQPRQSFTYQFIASPAGTHWYHSHISNQRLDGLYGPLIVHKRVPELPYHTVMLHDWSHVDGEMLQLTTPYHQEHRGTGETYNSPTNSAAAVDGTELSAKSYVSTLLNGRGRHKEEDRYPLADFPVKQDEKYRFRVIHSGAEYAYEVQVDAHRLSLVASDGFDMKPMTVDSFIIYPGERFDFELSANQTVGRYWMRAETIGYSSGSDVAADDLVFGGLSLLVYNGSDDAILEERRVCTVAEPCTVFNCPYRGYPSHIHKTCLSFNEAEFATDDVDVKDMFGTEDTEYEEIFLNWGFPIGSSVNARKFVEPSAPLFGNHEDSIVPCDESACQTGCKCTNMLSLPHNKTIQMVLLTYQPLAGFIGHHSIHLHGHSFAVLKMGFPEYNQTTGKWIGQNPDIQCDTDQFCANAFWKDDIDLDLNVENPPVKDSIVIPARGYVVIRFKTLNPGYWFFHCHMEAHALEGMAMILNEGPGHHPPLPPDFPECAEFHWDAEGFQDYLEQDTGSSMTSVVSTTGSLPPSTLPPSTELPDKATTTPYDFSKLEQCLQNSDNQVTFELDVFIGAMVGFVALGALLATLPLLCYVCCTQARQRGSK